MNKEYPLISVIVPVYNTEQYLRKCVESIQNQTYPNIEIILVDDESSDGSPQVCDQLAKEDSRIHVVHQKSKGPGGARNSGKHASNGEYIAFVDSDDYIEPIIYEKMYQASVKYNTQIISSGFIRESVDETRVVRYLDEVYDSRYAIEQLVKVNQAGGNSPCNKLFKRDTIIDIDFPEHKLWEDMLVMYKIFEKAQRIATISYAGYHYVQRGESIVHNNQGIDECRRVQAFFERAEAMEEKYPQLSYYSFDGIALECMRNCFRILKSKKKRTGNYMDTYAIGKNAYNKFIRKYPVSIKKYILYHIFYGLSN